MTKLNQIVAITSGKKTETKKEITELHRHTQADQLFSGLARTYVPLDDDGDTYPNEGTAVQLTVDKVLEAAEGIWSDTFDLVATQDIANCDTKVDVKVDDTVIINDVPVTYLMYLEKQLQDVEKFVQSLPVLDPSVEWTFDDTRGCYVSDAVRTVKTKKVPQHKVLYDATEHHPAQIETWTEDVPVGTWSTTKFSGAMSAPDKASTLVRVRELQKAVKFAREEANSKNVKNVNVADGIFGYLFADKGE